jgi:flavin reductase (DIM6/NTAB) family NADH-FMN oxidoreductase RutF
VSEAPTLTGVSATHTVFDAADPDVNVYRLLTALVVPRTITCVSTLSADGAHNLAPHSFFTVASALPPIVRFTSVGTKDVVAVTVRDDALVDGHPDMAHLQPVSRLGWSRLGPNSWGLPPEVAVDRPQRPAPGVDPAALGPSGQLAG